MHVRVAFIYGEEKWGGGQKQPPTHRIWFEGNRNFGITFEIRIKKIWSPPPENNSLKKVRKVAF